MHDFESELRALRLTSIYRRLKKQESESSTRGVIDGKHAVFFAGNDYLGLSFHDELKKASARGAIEYGTSARASRLVTGNGAPYAQLERALAKLKRKEAALVFPSGYMTNLGFLAAVTGPDDVVFMDKLNHASLYDGCRLSGASLRRYRHRDIDHLEKLLKQEPALKAEGLLKTGSAKRTGYLHKATSRRHRYIVTDGVFSMDGDLAPLCDLKRLAEEYECLLVVDDAHGTGILGPCGEGTCAHLGVVADFEIGTLSKALGSLGGFIAADIFIVEYLINKSRPFIFTTGLPASVLAASLRAVELLHEEDWRRAKLLELAGRARRALAEAGFDIPAGFTPIIPVIVGDERTAIRFSEACLEKGVLIPAIRTPAVPKGSARLRMTVCANHSDAELDLALDVLVEAGKELELI